MDANELQEFGKTSIGIRYEVYRMLHTEKFQGSRTDGTETRIDLITAFHDRPSGTHHYWQVVYRDTTSYRAQPDIDPNVMSRIDLTYIGSNGPLGENWQCDWDKIVNDPVRDHGRWLGGDQAYGWCSDHRVHYPEPHDFELLRHYSALRALLAQRLVTATDLREKDFLRVALFRFEAFQREQFAKWYSMLSTVQSANVI